MAKKALTNQQVDEILDSLSGIRKAEPRPFFYTRLQSRMSAESDNSTWGRVVSMLSRPAVALGALTIFLTLNGVILYKKFDQKAPVQQDSTQALAMEYVDNNAGIYDLNQENP